LEPSKLDRPESMLERAGMGKEKAHRPNDFSKLETAHNLSKSYWKEAKNAEAERILLRALERRNVEHTSTLDTVINLRNLYIT
jgi:hypothetical protein